MFWLALAVTQHKHGRLEARVKDRALAVLDQELGLDRWREIGSHAVRGRLKQLELTPSNRARELRGVIEGTRLRGRRRATVVTLDQADRLIEDGVEIDVVPAWRWMA